MTPPDSPTSPLATQANLLAVLDGIDVYLLDQVMKNRLRPGMKILDAGCGGGRNLGLFLRFGYEVWGVDENPRAIESCRQLAARVAPRIPAEHFAVGRLDALADVPGVGAETFDAVLCVAVLHFAADRAHFTAMLHALWRALRPGGLFFARLASSIGIENHIQPLADGRFRLGDGSTRFLVSEADLLEFTTALNAEFLEPIKTVNVQNQRCMTTWCLRKP